MSEFFMAIFHDNRNEQTEKKTFVFKRIYIYLVCLVFWVELLNKNMIFLPAENILLVKFSFI